MTDNGSAISRLNSQLSFTRPKEALSRISEEAENAGDGVSTDNGHRKSTHSYATAAGFTMWDDTNPLTFSVGPPKRAKTTITNDVDDIESQQTSYADMLDLAVQHIRSLQNQVQVSEQTSFMPL
ncbi:UNVERIFIED_CONTAM: hypothetical protein Sangu_0694900 [Sesamum angustifolium]|uniref:Uncharacterized protein n=1 Tax=Sesamum angustifolium TaxID=2727405 RepID=A0AAW2PQH3_9LAMI